MRVFTTHKNTDGRNISMFRRHFNVSTVVAIVTLVFAMTGGAFAVSGKGNSKGPVASVAKKKKKAKVLRGPRGLKGATGATGPAGKEGAPGKEGAAGKAGTNGTNGTNGKDGVSVTGAAASNAECPNGGEKYTSASGSTPVCNGANGTTGFTETLPKGSTETGTFAAYNKQTLPLEGSAFHVYTSISFPIPLPVPTETGRSAKIEYVKQSFPNPVGTANCKGSFMQATAEPGYLCLYILSAVREKEVNRVVFTNEEGYREAGKPDFSEVLFEYASRWGVQLNFESVVTTSASQELEMEATGAWAVTAK